MKVLVIGSGAREHALAHVLSRSAEVVVCPGNPGINGRSAEGHRISSQPGPPEGIAADLIVIGPEAPLVDGLADRLRAAGRRVFGPGADGARLEGSKAFMKDVAARAGVPTARYGAFTRRDDAVAFLDTLPGAYVVKADGLAGGKGVLVTEDRAEALADIEAKLSGRAFGDAGRRVVIEEGLSGPEVSLLVLCDGSRCEVLPAAQDAKRLGDGDRGPNTGGMGAYSPVPVAGEAAVGQIMERIVGPTLGALRGAGIDYRGVLYAGCMLTEAGPKLIEFNVRFGDPEAEVVLPRLSGDVAGLLAEVADGRLRTSPVVVPEAAVCVVLAAAGYPGAPVSGDVISGVERAGTVSGVTVLHAGTRRGADGRLATAGGRVLAVSALGPSLPAARDAAYRAVGEIDFHLMQYRRDIAAGAAVAHAQAR